MNCSGSALPFLGAHEPHGLASKVKSLQRRKNKDNDQQSRNWLLSLFLLSYQHPSDPRGRPFPSCYSSGSEIMLPVLARRDAEAVPGHFDSAGPGQHTWQDTDPLSPSAQSSPRLQHLLCQGPQQMGRVQTCEEGQQWRRAGHSRLWTLILRPMASATRMGTVSMRLP